MNSKQHFFILLVLFVTFSGTLFAQITTGQNQRSSEYNDDENYAASQILEGIDPKMDLYEKELPLDAFEKAVLRNMILDFEKNKLAIQQDEKIDYMDKKQNLLTLADKFLKDLEEILSKEKISNFNSLYFDPDIDKKIKKESRKRKRKKD